MTPQEKLNRIAAILANPFNEHSGDWEPLTMIADLLEDPTTPEPPTCEPDSWANLQPRMGMNMQVQITLDSDVILDMLNRLLENRDRHSPENLSNHTLSTVQRICEQVLVAHGETTSLLDQHHPAYDFACLHDQAADAKVRT
jgi:hypothetical protein